MNVYKDKAEIEKKKEAAITFLREQRGGKLLLELAEALANVTNAALETEKTGVVSLKVSIKPIAKGEMVEVSDDISVKIPRLSGGTGIFFATPSGDLSIAHKDQQALDLKEIDDGIPQSLRVVGGSSDISALKKI